MIDINLEKQKSITETKDEPGRWLTLYKYSIFAVVLDRGLDIFSYNFLHQKKVLFLICRELFVFSGKTFDIIFSPEHHLMAR